MNWFTQENTTGYTDSELDALNSELEGRLSGIEDSEQIEEVSQNFSDDVSRR